MLINSEASLFIFIQVKNILEKVGTQITIIDFVLIFVFNSVSRIPDELTP